MTNGKKTLGILGGMGPLASGHFLNLILSHTSAGCDREHLNLIMTSRASTPDRTAHILGKSDENPLDTMKTDVDTLIFGGAELIAVPCNTAMAYFDELSSYSRVPVLNTVRLSARRAARHGAKTVAVMATEGTIKSGIYQKELEKLNVKCVFPNEETQRATNELIYRRIKAGSHKVNFIYPIFDSLIATSDGVILGCTELSLVDLTEYKNRKYIIDSSLVLAENAIALCGGTVTKTET